MSLGAGATTGVERPMTWRRRSADALAGGGTTELSSCGVGRNWRSVSGGGAMIAFFEKTGGADVFRPSAGGGPGMGFSASRFATGNGETGNFRFGASTTFSLGEL